MITTSHLEGRVNVTVLGEFTLADYKEFEEVFNYKVKFEGPVSLFFDLREMSGFTVDMALEEIRFAREHAHDFTRIAILTDDQWITWSAWLSQLFVDADVQVFSDAEDADSWISGIATPVV
ncbi:STAS/SEC14 domain-containing protein [Zoogloea sp.]|uniref:STAS/SEC14 domain-containing protein n=1 Tax=Zoogloea sp. TaxID=49181 RepID=UPI0026040F2A|nr:STAS/SEC14 domain-containing protein [Zoogloea sp.]MDD3353947.1 STAS/SEC14 domain-containing protein [Zoogloea sp.]